MGSMESSKPVAVPPLKATHSHLSFCLRSTSSLLGPTAAAAQASICGENDSRQEMPVPLPNPYIALKGFITWFANCEDVSWLGEDPVIITLP